ncbi:MAG: AAA family ATPase [Myxococcales bacterium]|nr:AAA family ATPase [Myxococcales bacterium]
MQRGDDERRVVAGGEAFEAVAGGADGGDRGVAGEPRAVEPERAEADLLGQFAAIETLVEALGALEPPACVALYGAWGSGKTTVMHNAMRRCRERLWVPVWFTPWEYDRQPDLLQPLLRALLEVIREMDGKDPARWAEFKARAGKAVKALIGLAARVGVRVGVNAVLGPLAAAAAGAAASAAAGGTGADVITSDESAALDVQSWLDGKDAPPDPVVAVKKRFKELVDAALAVASEGGAPDDDKRVVFFLDDLDRCLPDRVVELIEGVKLLLCGETGCKAMFVFALDRQIVGEAIRQRFPGSTLYTGENYLEKIFDLSLETPPLPLGAPEGREADAAPIASLRRFVDAGAAGLKCDLDSLCKPLGGRTLLLEVLSHPAFANPRVIKRTLNRLHLLTRVETRCEQIAAVRDRECQRRFLLWMAGAERFREFRHFARRGSPKELDALADAASRTQGDTANGELKHLLAMPGFRGYFDGLKLEAKFGKTALTEWQVWQDYKPTEHQHSLRWFDDLMRAVGV